MVERHHNARELVRQPQRAIAYLQSECIGWSQNHGGLLVSDSFSRGGVGRWRGSAVSRPEIHLRIRPSDTSSATAAEASKSKTKMLRPPTSARNDV